MPMEVLGEETLPGQPEQMLLEKLSVLPVEPREAQILTDLLLVP